jgi:hypothetical protein
VTTIAPEVEAAARARTREYLRTNGTLVPAATIRRRVSQSFETLEKILHGADAATAARRAWPGEWSLHEIADHVLETHRPSLHELRDLLAGRRPSGPPVPASLQSAAPLARPWPALLDEMHEVHTAIVAALASAPDDLPTDTRARVVVVINVEATDGATVPLMWEDEIDWKSYAIFLRLHAVDHFSQAKKVLAALSP